MVYGPNHKPHCASKYPPCYHPTGRVPFQVTTSACLLVILHQRNTPFFIIFRAAFSLVQSISISSIMWNPDFCWVNHGKPTIFAGSKPSVSATFEAAFDRTRSTSRPTPSALYVAGPRRVRKGTGRLCSWRRHGGRHAPVGPWRWERKIVECG